MTLHRPLLALAALAALAAGCYSGASVLLWPSSGDVNLYHQNFDGNGYIVANEWGASSGLTFALDSSISSSPPNCLKIGNSSASANVAVHTLPGVVPSYSSGDVYTQVNLALNGFTSTTTKLEFVCYQGGSVTALIGYDPSNHSLYSPLSSGARVLKTGVSGGQLLGMVAHPSGTADYWLDGRQVATDVHTSASRPISGGPSDGFAVWLPSALSGSDVVRIDNLSIFHR